MRVIAFYLPQFHSFPKNDEWWGKGFTEWTNVGKARPLFKKHYQPRVPGELGYYNLKMPEIREAQAEMARDAGVEGFMYWHYWFGGGETLLTEIIEEVGKSGKPDYPFCIGWANHTWYAKNWNPDGTSTNRILQEQTYPGREDARAYFESLLPLFRDHRYIKVDDKPLMLIYDPESVPADYMNWFREWCIDEGFAGIYFAGYIGDPRKDKKPLLEKGFDIVLFQRLTPPQPRWLVKMGIAGKALRHGLRHIRGLLTGRPPFCYNYKDIYPTLVTEEEKDFRVAPVLLPNWDHTPRSGRNGVLLHDSRPEYFYDHARRAFDAVKGKRPEEQIVFLKSWNEWGEGNYMEPDLKYGRGYVEALRRAIDDASSES